MEQVIERLRVTAAGLASEVERFTDAQWVWRPSNGTWTAQENAEHLILVERGVLTLIRRAMAAPASERGTALTDEEVWGRLTVVTKRAPAPERVQPSGNWTDRATAIAEWNRLRDETILCAQTTNDPLRERWLQLPVGQVDGAQGLIMLAGHALRHTVQIRELRAAPGFPAA
jgi:hypothetical protein